jgi:hypothetical protein
MECFDAPDRVFNRCPHFDIGHARQVDPTMNGAFILLEEFGQRMIQVHLSEVNANSTHGALSPESVLAFRKVSELIPETIPIILEFTISEDQMGSEISRALEALPIKEKLFAAQ